MKLLLLTSAVIAILLPAAAVSIEIKEDVKVEQSTESTIAPDTTLMGDAIKADAANATNAQKTEEETLKQHPVNSQQHTIADFIIHPLIALKPRVPVTENGKQAQATGSTTPPPWQLFNFNPGQSIGSSVSSLADTFTGWLGNRVQFSGLVDTPVREATTTTTTTTTAKPDVVVRIQQRPATKKPTKNNNRPNRINIRPNRYNVNYLEVSEENDDSTEYDDFGNFNRKRVNNHKRYQAYENDDSNEDDDAEGNEETDYGNNHSDEEEIEEEYKKPAKQQKNKSNSMNDNERRYMNNQRRRINNKPEESTEVDQYDDDFYYSKKRLSQPSQNELNFIRRNQQSLLNQVKPFSRPQNPSDVGNSLRKPQTVLKNKHQQQTVILINRKGQTFYVAPELLEVINQPTDIKPYYAQYPQAPFRGTNKRKTQPNQYITVPLSQLVVSRPEQTLFLSEDVQSQPLILKVPPKPIDKMQSLTANKKKPTLTPTNAVPLLAEASIMEIIKPPRIPPVRTPAASTTTKKSSAVGSPIVVATKLKPGPTRIGPTTLVERAPAAKDEDEKENSAESMEDDSNSSQYIVVADESVGKKLSNGAYRQILNYFKQNRVGRQVSGDAATPLTIDESREQLIPVQIVTGKEEPLKDKEISNDPLEMSTQSHIVIDNNKNNKLEELQIEKSEPMIESSTSA